LCHYFVKPLRNDVVDKNRESKVRWREDIRWLE
jgi:hypothetical protein